MRFKVENSWSDTAGDHGYFVMTNDWFDEYVYQIVLPRGVAPDQLRGIYEDSEPSVLPPWGTSCLFPSFFCTVGSTFGSIKMLTGVVDVCQTPWEAWRDCNTLDAFQGHCICTCLLLLLFLLLSLL